MFSKKLAAAGLLLGLLSSAADPAAAAPGAFTTPDAFAAAVPESLATFDFESIPGGTDVSGTTLAVGAGGGNGGITLPGPLADVLDPGGPSLSLRVVADTGDNPASSGSRSLGVGDPGNFDALTAGTTLDFSFPEPVLAFGLTLITPEEPDAALFDDDLLLLVPGESTASLVLSDGEALGTFGGRAYRRYFLGVVGAAPFSSARLEAGGATPTSGFFYNVDDLRIPLPEPGAASGLLLGSAFLLLLGPRRKGSVCSPRSAGAGHVIDLALPVQVLVSTGGGGGSGSSVLDFDPVQVTVPQSASGALLSARLLSGAPQTVRVFVPDADSPRNPPLEVLVLQNAVFQKVEDAALPGRIAVELSFETVTLEWGGTGWGWNLSTNTAITGPGCSSGSSNESHVDLAGNATTQLQAGEIESTHRLSLAPPPALPVFSYTRKPANACALRFLTERTFDIDVSFDRLWPQDEQFAGRQSVETIDFVGVGLRSWTFRIASGQVLEDIELPLIASTDGIAVGTGVQTLRDFDPSTGAETSAESVVFLDEPTE